VLDFSQSPAMSGQGRGWKSTEWLFTGMATRLSTGMQAVAYSSPIFGQIRRPPALIYNWGNDSHLHKYISSSGTGRAKPLGHQSFALCNDTTRSNYAEIAAFPSQMTDHRSTAWAGGKLVFRAVPLFRWFEPFFLF
jgi:hypothetical protein